MNVLHLMPRFEYFGGTAKKLQFLFQHPEYGCRHFCAVGKKDGTDWVVGFVPISLDCSDKITLEANCVCSLINDLRIDLIISHFFHMSMVAMLSSIKMKIPFICQEHGINLGETFTKYPLRCLIYARSKFIIVNSYATARMINTRYPLVKNKLRIVYNGVSKPPIANNYSLRDIIGVPHNSLCIGMIGGFIPIRRHELLIKVVSIACKEIDELHLVCLGEGGSEQNRLKHIAKKIAPHNVHFLPRTEYVGSFLQEIDIFVNPAIAEGFGMATCEAMLMKKAVIVSNAGALPEYCMNGHNAIVVPPDDSLCLLNAIKSLLKDASLRNRLGENAFRDISSRFSAELYIMNTNAFCHQAFCDSYHNNLRLKNFLSN